MKKSSAGEASSIKIKNAVFSKRPLLASLALTLALGGCVTQNQKGEQLSFEESLKETFASDDPCANSRRNLGMLIGGVAGVILGNQVEGKNQAKARVAGGLLGTMAGGFIGSELDKRQCELSKIQKKYALNMQVTPIAVIADANSDNQSAQGRRTPPSVNNSSNINKEPQEVGLSVSIIDQEGRAQFLSGSDSLEPDAKKSFREIANQYSAEYLAKQGGAMKPEDRSSLVREMRKKRVLLIGHTDDTGNSKLNADLSERRARAVAEVFKSMGVAEDQLFYQGAGETLPTANNASPEGRAKNRRVEIVDLSNKDTFRLYLESRRPNTAYYRSTEPTDNSRRTVENAKEGSVSAPRKPAMVKAVPTIQKERKSQNASQVSSAQQTANTNRSIPTQVTLKRGFIDFGGSPVTQANTAVNLGNTVKTKQGLILISEAQANAMSPISSCTRDRPRYSGAVKSFKGGSTHATNEHLPGLYGRSWQDTVNGNLVILNGVTVLRDGAAPANVPELKVYTNYNPLRNRNPKPDVSMTPPVNTYRGSNGLLYRVFTRGERGMQCMDVLMPADGSPTAKVGKLIYGNDGSEFVADFKPKMIR